MITEDALRAALHSHADRVEPIPGSLRAIEHKLADPAPREWKRLILPIAAAAAMIAGISVVPGLRDQDDAATVGTVAAPSPGIAPRLSEQDERRFIKDMAIAHNDWRDQPVYLVLKSPRKPVPAAVVATVSRKGEVFLGSRGYNGAVQAFGGVAADPLDVRENISFPDPLVVGYTTNDAVEVRVSIQGTTTDGAPYAGDFTGPVLAVPGARTRVFALLLDLRRLRLKAIRTEVLDASGTTVAVSPGGYYPFRLRDEAAGQLRTRYPELGPGELNAILAYNKAGGVAQVVASATPDGDIAWVADGFAEMNVARLRRSGLETGWAKDGQDLIVVGSAETDAKNAFVSIEGSPGVSTPLLELPGTHLKVFAARLWNPSQADPTSLRVELLDDVGKPTMRAAPVNG